MKLKKIKSFKNNLDEWDKRVILKYNGFGGTIFTGFFSREIIIHHNHDLTKNGLYVLLYEVAKILQLDTNPSMYEYQKLDINKKPKEYKLGKLLQENAAWEQSLTIAKTLYIDINISEWKTLKEKYLLQYMN